MSDTQTPGEEAPAGAPRNERMPGGGPPAEMPPIQPMPEKASGMAIAAIILSILGLLCGIPTAIVGIVLGAVELRRIGRGESAEKGKSLALAGIIIGAVVLVMSIIITLILLATGGFSWEVTT